MLGRATPSPQLDKVAAYVAGEFQRFGLKPGGDNGSYQQRYPLTSVAIVPESSYVRLTGDVRAEWKLGRDASYYRGQARAGESSRSEEHTSELQSRLHLVCRLLLEKKKKQHAARGASKSQICT